MVGWRMLRVFLSRLLAFGATTALAVSGGMAHAQTRPVPENDTSSPVAQLTAAKPPAEPDPWRFNVALYGWAINIGGNLTVRNQTIDTNASFLDLVQHSDSLAGLMGYFEANKGPASLYLDMVYTKLGFSAAQTNYRNPIAGLNLTLNTQQALVYQMFIAELGGVYELHRWPGATGSFTAIDGLLGFRYWNMSVDASFDAQLNADVPRLGFDRTFGLAIARADSIQWVDPVLGLRLRHQFTPHQSLFVRADIGGFGLGGSSLTWQAVGVYSYAWPIERGEIALLLGFRALGVNYGVPDGNNGFALNETMYGPLIGVSWRF
jgi:hypothetical protein